MNSAVRTLVVALAVVALTPRGAEARSCVILPNACAALAADEAIVFEATVVGQAERPREVEGLGSVRECVLTLRDVRSWRGRAATTVVTQNHGLGCSEDFRPGARYLFDAVRRDGDLHTSMGCSHTRTIDAAGGLIAYLESLNQPPAGGVAFGRVTVPTYGQGASRPVARVPVTISGPRTETVETDASGVFVVKGLPPGEYRVDITPPSGMSVQGVGPFRTFALDGAHACEEVQATLGEANRVAGLALDGEGRPLGGVFVSLDRAGPGLDWRDLGFLGYTTGPDGRYVFASVPAGRYRVSVGAHTGPVPMSPFEVTYAIGTSGTRDIDVSSESRLELSPLRLRRLQPVSLAGRVQTADERGVTGVDVRLVPVSDFGRETPGFPTRVGGEGAFRLDAYAGARYVLQVLRRRTVIVEQELVAGPGPLVVTIPPQ